MEFKILEQMLKYLVLGIGYNSHMLGDRIRRITRLLSGFCYFNSLVGVANVFDDGLEVLSRRLQQTNEWLVVQGLVGVQLQGKFAMTGQAGNDAKPIGKRLPEVDIAVRDIARVHRVLDLDKDEVLDCSIFGGCRHMDVIEFLKAQGLIGTEPNQLFDKYQVLEFKT